MSIFTHKYRPVEQTYPFFDVTFSDNESGRIGGINAFQVAAYEPGANLAGTRVFFVGGAIGTINDNQEDFERRLQETLDVTLTTTDVETDLEDEPSQAEKTLTKVEQDLAAERKQEFSGATPIQDKTPDVPKRETMSGPKKK